MKMKTLALVAAGSLALLGGSNAFAQCNFNAWLPANGNTGGAAIQDGVSITSPTIGGNLKPGSPRDATNPVTRYAGRCGLRAAAGAQPNYVQDGSPNETATFRARFYVRPTTALNGTAVVYRARNATNADVITVTYNPASGGSFTVASSSGGGTATFSPAPAGTYYAVELAWATSPASLSTTVRNAGTDVNLTGTGNPITNLGSATQSIDTVQLGFTGGTATAGVVFADAYESRRQNQIGFICRGNANTDNTRNILDIVAIAGENNSTTEASLAVGAPDATADGNVNILDIVAVAGIANSVSPTCPPL